MNYVDRLNEGLKLQLQHPWFSDLSGGERVWFLVFDPDQLRKVLKRRDKLEQTVVSSGHIWHEIDISHHFGAWLAQEEYVEAYYLDPSLSETLAEDYAQSLIQWLGEQLPDDPNSLVVLSGVEALYGITRVSHIVRSIEDRVRGRLMVLFPGKYEGTSYRLLDARDGWNYLAVPILPIQAGGSQ